MKEKKEEDKSSKFLQVSAHPPYEQKKMKTNNHFQPMDIKTQPQFNHYSLGHKLMHHIMNWNTTVTPVRKNSFMQWLVHLVSLRTWPRCSRDEKRGMRFQEHPRFEIDHKPKRLFTRHDTNHQPDLTGGFSRRLSTNRSKGSKIP